MNYGARMCCPALRQVINLRIKIDFQLSEGNTFLIIHYSNLAPALALNPRQVKQQFPNDASRIKHTIPGEQP